MMSFGIRIIFLRGWLTQTQFANKLGVHRNVIGVWEREIAEPKAKLH